MRRGPGCAAGESRPSGGGAHPHVAADHPRGQTRLKRLVDDEAASGEISLAAGDELGERQFLRHAAAPRFEHKHRIGFAGGLDLPYPLAVIAAVLLQDARAVGLEPGRKHGIELSSGAVE